MRISVVRLSQITNALTQDRSQTSHFVVPSELHLQSRQRLISPTTKSKPSDLVSPIISRKVLHPSCCLVMTWSMEDRANSPSPSYSAATAEGDSTNTETCSNPENSGTSSHSDSLTEDGSILPEHTPTVYHQISLAAKSPWSSEAATKEVGVMSEAEDMEVVEPSFGYSAAATRTNMTVEAAALASVSAEINDSLDDNLESHMGDHQHGRRSGDEDSKNQAETGVGFVDTAELHRSRRRDMGQGGWRVGEGMSIPAGGEDAVWTKVKANFERHFGVNISRRETQGRKGSQFNSQSTSTLGLGHGNETGTIRRTGNDEKSARSGNDCKELRERRDAIVNAVRWAWKVGVLLMYPNCHTPSIPI